jgi:hypothetical protein
MYLQRLGHVMNDYAAGESYLATDAAGGTLILRWMDDIWAFGDVDPHPLCQTVVRHGTYESFEV